MWECQAECCEISKCSTARQCRAAGRPRRRRSRTSAAQRHGAGGRSFSKQHRWSRAAGWVQWKLRDAGAKGCLARLLPVGASHLFSAFSVGMEWERGTSRLTSHSHHPTCLKQGVCASSAMQGRTHAVQAAAWGLGGDGGPWEEEEDGAPGPEEDGLGPRRTPGSGRPIGGTTAPRHDAGLAMQH